jgi:RHS repeat-associated protein
MPGISDHQISASRVEPECLLLAVAASSSILGAAQSTFVSFSYSVYGNLARRTGVAPLLAFNGIHLHKESGLYLLGNGKRAFSSMLMRFLSADSYSPFGAGGINAYAYCSGDPINRVDPSGQISNWLKNRSTSLNHFIPSRATPKSSIGEFSKFQGAPHITERIVRQLDAADLMSLSYTSRGMNELTHDAASPISPFLNPPPERALSRLLYNDLFEIATGKRRGMMPSQVIRAGVNPNQIAIVRDLGNGYVESLSSINSPEASDLHAEMRATQESWRIRNSVNR